MWSKLPNEILEQIFTHPKISKKDLLELQLTCTQWSPLAQKHFYKNIRMIDYDLYSKTLNDYPAMKKRFTALIQSLVLVNNQPGKYIETLDIAFLLHEGDNSNALPEDMPLNIAMIAHQCPNLISINGLIKSTEYLNTLTHLHREGYLQRLESIRSPNISNARDITTYHTTILEFKDTLKHLFVVDGISKTISTDSLIPPTSLQLFTSADHIRLLEFSRIHLYRFKDYISNCGPKVKSLSINMNGAIAIPLQVEYNGQQSVQPQDNIEKFHLNLESSITSNELSTIMQMFPSLKKISLSLRQGSDDTGFNWHDMPVVAQFFTYLSLIPEVDCCRLWFGVSLGLELLPLLKNAIGMKQLSITNSNAMERTGLSINIQKPSQATKFIPDRYTASKTNGPHIAIVIYSTEASSSFTTALEKLKDPAIESISIDTYYSQSDTLQQLDQHLLDYITNHYPGVQNLLFNHFEFPSQAPRSAIQQVQQLRYLHLNGCKITENYFTRLSCQFERIDYFKFSSNELRDNSNAAKKLRVHLPYTAIKTISLDLIGVKSCLIKVWANATCITLKAARVGTWKAGITLEEHEDVEGLPNDFDEVIVYCKSLKEVRWYSATYQMP